MELSARGGGPLTPSLEAIDALEARVHELEQLIREFASTHEGHLSITCTACSAERRLRVIAKELAKS